MPMTEHSAEILAGSWPSQSVMAWAGYAMAHGQEANTLFSQLDVQMDIKLALGGMDGNFIESARSVVQSRETALQNRIEAYRHIRNKAKLAASELQATQTDLADIVNTAEQMIKALRSAADEQKSKVAAIPGAAEVIEAKFQVEKQGLIDAAKLEAQARDLQGATTVTALSHDIAQWAAPYINSMMPEAGGAGAGNMPASPAPSAPPLDGTTAKPIEYKTDAIDTNHLSEAQQSTAKEAQGQGQKNVQQAALRNDQDPKQAATQQQKPSPSPASSAPSSPSSGGSSSGSSPASSIGQMLKPASSGSSSPASSSSSPASSSGAGASPANAAQSSQMANAKPTPGGVPATGMNAATSGAGAAGRAPGLASLGAGIAESSARLASGAVNTAVNAASGAAGVGSNVAQNVVSQAAAQAPAGAAPPAAASTVPAAAAPAAGGPMMVPPAGAAGGGSSVINPVTSAPAGSPNVGGGPSSTPAANPTPVSGGSPQAGSTGSLAPAPVAMQGPGVRGIGADGASGDALFGQAVDAGRDVITALLAQTRGYMAIDYAVSVMWERSGQVTAWLATSEGASYIPLGVRVPQAVSLAINDPVVGRKLWDETAAAGGANPLEVVVRQAQAREMAAPGGRVLAIASSQPMDRVMDWAGEVGARPVSVNPKTVPTDLELPATRHRCQVGMPWEWQQAHQFSEEKRHQVAARHVLMAAMEGHLHSPACEEVMDRFEARKPIDDALWQEVTRERFGALIEYQTAMANAGHGGAVDPARALATARAAEVVECLRTHTTAEGCADLLYAARLAGAPLAPSEVAASA